MIAIDTTVVNLALPLIGRGLRTPVSGLQWTIAAYTISTASLMLTAGSIGDKFGRRPVFQAGLALYTLSSLGCSLAPGAGWLIACRALQGAGGAALTPMSLGIITATFTEPAARARAIGIWTGTFGAGMAAGPVIGGALAAVLGWRSVFWITVPPGLIAFVLARLILPQSRAARPRRFDPPGQALVIALLACLVYGIIEGPSAGWRSAPIVGAFGAAALALAGLVAWERRRADPLIELRVFRSVPFTGALVITLCAFAGLGGFLFLTGLYLQYARGLNVWHAGLWLLPLAAGSAAAPPLTGRVLARYGARWPLVLGGAALAAGCLALAQTPTAASGLLVLSIAYVIFGAGYGAVNTVVFAAAVAGMPSAQAGVAGGMSSAGRQAGQSLGVSVTGAVLAIGLHGSLRQGFTAASHPAWLLNAACGLAVLLLGLVTTSRRAIRTAARVAAPLSDRSSQVDDRAAMSEEALVEAEAGPPAETEAAESPVLESEADPSAPAADGTPAQTQDVPPAAPKKQTRPRTRKTAPPARARARKAVPSPLSAGEAGKEQSGGGDAGDRGGDQDDRVEAEVSLGADEQTAESVDLVGERVDLADGLEPAGHDLLGIEGVGAEEERHSDGLADAHEPVAGESEPGDGHRQAGEEGRAEDHDDRGGQELQRVAGKRDAEDSGQDDDHRGLNDRAHPSGKRLARNKRRARSGSDH
jgi:EmrB/QacA subfamily drug resistance transporter